MAKALYIGGPLAGVEEEVRGKNRVVEARSKKGIEIFVYTYLTVEVADGSSARRWIFGTLPGTSGGDVIDALCNRYEKGEQVC